MLNVEKKQKSSEDTTECDATNKIDHQTSKQLPIRHVHSQPVCEDVNASYAAWFLRRF
jgi:hypothetical protein